MSDEDKEWGVPDDAPTQLRLTVDPGAPEPIKMGVKAKDAPVVVQAALTVEQAAVLETHINEVLDELDERPETRIREMDDEPTKGVY